MSATTSADSERLKQKTPPRDEEPRPSGRGSSVLPIVVALLAVSVAYHYSLMSLTRTLKLETPLAYLGLVPFIALGLAVAKCSMPTDEPDIHDRQLDYLVGLPMLVGALVMLFVGPLRLSSLFWVWRVDLLSLPLFVAGTLAIVFGLRTMWRVRFAIVFLFLAWPLPYLKIFNGMLERSSQLTIEGVKAALFFLPLATPVAGSDGSLFRIEQGSTTFLVSVASACSGVNGILGFLLVGVAFAVLVRGTRARKLSWLLAGIATLWAVNILRILMIFGVGRVAGERVALEVLHPVLGLATFAFGVGLMIAALPRFGLHIGRQDGDVFAPPSRVAGAGRQDTLVAPKPAPIGSKGLTLVVAMALLASVANAGLRQYSGMADDTGQPRLVSYTESPTQLPGWSLSLYDSYDTGKRFFGETSSWTRFMYASETNIEEPGSPIRAAAPVLIDVISTPNRQSLADYGLEACYRFHGYKIRHSSRVDVGGGVVGTLISFYNSKEGRDWSTLHWETPVQSFDGLRYERVVLMMIDARKASLAAPPPSSFPAKSNGRTLGIRPDHTGSRNAALDVELQQVSDFLTGFARAALAGQAKGHLQTGLS